MVNTSTQGIVPFNPTVSAPIFSTKVPSVVPKGTGILGSLSPTVSVISSVLPVFQKLISGEVFSKTIGQLKDGFDCWGSTWTPTRAKNELPQWMEKMGILLGAEFSLDNDTLEQRVNAVFTTGIWNLDVTGTPLHSWIGWRYDTAKDCTKRGLEELESGIDLYLPQMESAAVSAFKQMGYDVVTSKKSVTLSRHLNGQGKKYNKSVPQFKISQSSLLSSFGGSTSGGGSVLGMGILAFFFFRKFIKS